MNDKYGYRTYSPGVHDQPEMVVMMALQNENADRTDNEKIDFLFSTMRSEFGLTRVELCSKSRKRELVEYRQIAMHILKGYTTLGCSAIGRIFKKDHATVLHSIKTVENLLRTDKNFAYKFNSVKQRVRPILVVPKPRY